MNDRTKEMVATALTENTGTHILDSGMANGRAWQQNAMRQEREGFTSAVEMFEAEEDVFVDYQFGSITISAFHFWSSFLDYAEQLDGQYLAFAEGNRDSWHSNLLDWFQHLEDSGIDITYHIYGEAPEPQFVNTYNHCSPLSQDAQFALFQIDGENYIAFSSHNGADARGGYSRYYIFEDCSDDGLGALSDERYEAIVDLREEIPEGVERLFDVEDLPEFVYAMHEGNGNWCGWDNSDLDSLFEDALNRPSVFLDSDELLPIDSDTLYWVHNNDHVEDGVYWRARKVTFYMDVY